jgi:hypothetical protein
MRRRSCCQSVATRTMIPDLEFFDVWLVFEVCRRDVGGLSALVGCLLAFVGVCRSLLEFVGVCRCLPVFAGVCWCLSVFVSVCRTVGLSDCRGMSSTSEHVGARQSTSEHVMSENVGGMSYNVGGMSESCCVSRLARY